MQSSSYINTIYIENYHTVNNLCTYIYVIYLVEVYTSEMGQYCDASESHNTSYSKLSIDASIYQCIAVYWWIKCSMISMKNLWRDNFVKNGMGKAFYNHEKIAYIIHRFRISIIEMFKSIQFNKQWCIVVLWCSWCDALILLHPVSFHL